MESGVKNHGWVGREESLDQGWVGGGRLCLHVHKMKCSNLIILNLRDGEDLSLLHLHASPRGLVLSFFPVKHV